MTLPRDYALCDNCACPSYPSCDRYQTRHDTDSWFSFFEPPPGADKCDAYIPTGCDLDRPVSGDDDLVSSRNQEKFMALAPDIQAQIYALLSTFNWNQTAAMAKLSRAVRCSETYARNLLNLGIAAGEVERFEVKVNSGYKFGYRLKETFVERSQGGID